MTPAVAARPPRATAPRRSVLRELGGGAGDLWRGVRLWASSPRLMLLGAIPALIVGAVFLAVFAGLLAVLPQVAAASTPFAAGWADAAREEFRILVGGAIALLAGVGLVLAFSAVTLAVGDPCYERIARHVEARLGGVPDESGPGLLAGLVRAARDGVLLLVAGAGVALLALLLGLIPVVGGPLAAVVAALLGGRLLTLELTGYAFEARGARFRERRAALRSRTARCTGFGVLAYLLLLLPVVSVIAMPAAVAGATILARRIIDEAAVPGRAR